MGDGSDVRRTPPYSDMVSPSPHPDDQYEVLSDLPEDSVVFYCRLCRERGEGKKERGEGGGEGVMVTWRQAVNKFMTEAFLEVRH